MIDFTLQSPNGINCMYIDNLSDLNTGCMYLDS